MFDVRRKTGIDKRREAIHQDQVSVVVIINGSLPLCETLFAKAVGLLMSFKITVTSCLLEAFRISIFPLPILRSP